jgi:hypothetical protein
MRGFSAQRVGSPNEYFANLRAANINPAAYFRANSVLPKNAEEVIDGAISRVGRDRLTIVSDLLDLGLTVPLPGWMGIPVLTTSMAGESGRAKVTETLTNVRGERQVPPIANLSIPTPITWDDWQFDPRFLAVADRVGYPINTTMVEQAARNNNEKHEDVAINGLVDADGNLIKVYDTPIYGLLNAPNHNTFTFENARAWDNAAKTGAGILADVDSAIALLEAAHYYGPYRLYIPSAYMRALSKDYTSGYPKTILARLLETPNLTIKGADFLPANTIVMFQPTSNVIDLIVGQLPTSSSWLTNPGQPMSGISSIVWSVIVPRVKYDYNLKSGIVVGTPT